MARETPLLGPQQGSSGDGATPARARDDETPGRCRKTPASEVAAAPTRLSSENRAPRATRAHPRRWAPAACRPHPPRAQSGHGPAEAEVEITTDQDG